MTIEVGGGQMGAAEMRQHKAEQKAKAPVLAKQKAQRRHKGSNDVHKVDRTHGQVRKPESGVHLVDRAEDLEKSWRRAYSLPSFPDPPGYVLCWIGRHRNRHGDDRGLLMALRERWIFVRPDEMEEEDLPTETFTGRMAKHGEVIGDETTVLMKLPVKYKMQRDAYYNRRRDQATREVTRRKPGLAEANSKMPLVEDINETEMTRPMMRARRAPTAEADA